MTSSGYRIIKAVTMLLLLLLLLCHSTATGQSDRQIVLLESKYHLQYGKIMSIFYVVILNIWVKLNCQHLCCLGV